MEQLEKIKEEIQKLKKEHEEAIKDFAKHELYLCASNSQLIIMAYEEVLGIIAKVEEDKSFF